MNKMKDGKNGLTVEQLNSLEQSFKGTGIFTDVCRVKVVKMEMLKIYMPLAWQAYLEYLENENHTFAFIALLEMFSQLATDEKITIYDMGDFISSDFEAVLYSYYELSYNLGSLKYFDIVLQTQEFILGNRSLKFPNFKPRILSPEENYSEEFRVGYLKTLLECVFEVAIDEREDKLDAAISRLGGFRECIGFNPSVAPEEDRILN